MEKDATVMDKSKCPDVMENDATVMGKSQTWDVFVEENQDLQPLEKDNKKYIGIPNGEKVNLKLIAQSSGGGSGNVAANLASLGHKVKVLSALGNTYQNQILKDLEKYGVNTKNIIRKNNPTNCSLIYRGSDGEATPLCTGNAVLEPGEVDVDRLLTGKLLHMSSLTPGSPLLKEAFEQAKSRGMYTTMNPNKSQIRAGDMEDARGKVDVIFLNASEAAELCNMKKARINKSVIKSMLRKIHRMGFGIVVITGREGAHAYDGRRFYFRESFTIRDEEKVCSLGCGDSFVGAFLGRFLHSIKNGGINSTVIEEAMTWGLASAASTLKSLTTKGGIMTRDELEKFIVDYNETKQRGDEDMKKKEMHRRKPGRIRVYGYNDGKRVHIVKILPPHERHDGKLPLLGFEVTIKGKKHYLIDGHKKLESTSSRVIPFPGISYSQVVSGKIVRYLYGNFHDNGVFEIMEKKPPHAYSHYALLGYEFSLNGTSHMLIEASPGYSDVISVRKPIGTGKMTGRSHSTALQIAA